MLLVLAASLSAPDESDTRRVKIKKEQLSHLYANLIGTIREHFRSSDNDYSISSRIANTGLREMLLDFKAIALKRLEKPNPKNQFGFFSETPLKDNPSSDFKLKR